MQVFFFFFTYFSYKAMFRYETTFLPVFFLFVSLKETIVWIDAAAVVKLIIQNKHNNILTTDMVCWIEYKKKT